jgi:hypothetical protein
MDKDKPYEYFYFTQHNVKYRMRAHCEYLFVVDVYADHSNPNWKHWTEGWNNWSYYTWRSDFEKHLFNGKI